MNYGKINIATGLFFLAFFMMYGFLLIYNRDFASNKLEWIANSESGAHFESRLAHVHGNLFAVLNIFIGYLMLQLNIKAKSLQWISIFLLGGMLMPLGILAELLFKAPPIFVLLGAISIIISIVWLGIEVIKKPK
jgi:hypothetical protein